MGRLSNFIFPFYGNPECISGNPLVMFRYPIFCFVTSQIILDIHMSMIGGLIFIFMDIHNSVKGIFNIRYINIQISTYRYPIFILISRFPSIGL